MPMDSEPIMISGSGPDDFTSIVLDIVSNVQFKLLGMMLLIFMIISSDVFINRALSKFQGAVDHKYPTSWGTFLQGLFLVFACILIDAAIRQKII
jgi:hypothetical protein